MELILYFLAGYGAYALFKDLCTIFYYGVMNR